MRLELFIPPSGLVVWLASRVKLHLAASRPALACMQRGSLPLWVGRARSEPQKHFWGDGVSGADGCGRSDSSQDESFRPPSAHSNSVFLSNSRGRNAPQNGHWCHRYVSPCISRKCPWLANYSRDSRVTGRFVSYPLRQMKDKKPKRALKMNCIAARFGMRGAPLLAKASTSAVPARAAHVPEGNVCVSAGMSRKTSARLQSFLGNVISWSRRHDPYK